MNELHFSESEQRYFLQKLRDQECGNFYLEVEVLCFQQYYHTPVEFKSMDGSVGIVYTV